MEIDKVIDCDVLPMVPEGWRLKSHAWHRPAECSLGALKLHLSWSQKRNEVVSGRYARREVLLNNPANASVLDFLLQNPELIPPEWDLDEEGKKTITFWGTEYFNKEGKICARRLRKIGAKYVSDYVELDSFFGEHDYALVINPVA